MTLMDTVSADEPKIIASTMTKNHTKTIEFDEDKSSPRNQCLTEISPNLIESGKETAFYKSEIEEHSGSNNWFATKWGEGMCSRNGDQSGPRQCSRCCQTILERFYFEVGNDQFWHRDCLRCEHCHQTLDNERTCFMKNGRVFCKQDYNKLFGNLCNTNRICCRCQNPLESSEMVMRARKSLFHVSCFTCCECDKCLKPGDEAVFKDSGKLFCLDHGKNPHSQRTFKELNHKLSQEGLNMKKLNAEKVSPLKPTKRIISPDRLKKEPDEHNEMTTLLQLGNLHSSISIKNDPSNSLLQYTSPELGQFDSKTNASLTLLTSGSDNDNQSAAIVESCQKMDDMNQSLFLQLNQPKKSKNKKKKKKANADDCLSQFSETGSTEELLLSDSDSLIGMDGGDGDANSGNSKGISTSSQRQKRVRTSFKHHQLRIMKSYFSVNHNPDAKDLKQLSQKTGLSKRVLQVWFQNARAKFRRSLQKQQELSGVGDNVNMVGNGSAANGMVLDPNNQNALQGMIPGPVNNRRMDCNPYQSSGGGVHHEEQESPSLSEISSAPPSLTEFGSPNNLSAMQESQQHYHFVNNPMLYPAHVMPSHSAYLGHLSGPSQQSMSAGGPLTMMSQTVNEPGHHVGMLPPHTNGPSQTSTSASFFSTLTHGINCLG